MVRDEVMVDASDTAHAVGHRYLPMLTHDQVVVDVVAAAAVLFLVPCILPAVVSELSDSCRRKGGGRDGGNSMGERRK